MDYAGLKQWFWNDDYWLPPNITWADLEPTADVPRADFDHLLSYPLLIAVVILCLRYVLEKRFYRLVGSWVVGVKERKRPMPSTNTVLEQVFATHPHTKLDHVTMARLSKELDMTERQIERWLRQRTLLVKHTKLDKFAESAWRATYYIALYAYGWYVLWDKPWFSNIRDCFLFYPNHGVPDSVWWYYMVELGFYYSLVVSQFFDVRRHDFWAMFSHHVATILLLSFSWTCNFFRVGTLVLWIHDCADVFLETAKMCKYAGLLGLANVLFYGFAISWIVTRLVIYPNWILYTITVEAGQFLQYFPVYHLFCLLLTNILILNLFWAYYIFKSAYLAYLSPTGKVERDLRSETSSSEEN